MSRSSSDRGRPSAPLRERAAPRVRYVPLVDSSNETASEEETWTSSSTDSRLREGVPAPMNALLLVVRRRSSGSDVLWHGWVPRLDAQASPRREEGADLRFSPMATRANLAGDGRVRRAQVAGRDSSRSGTARPTRSGSASTRARPVGPRRPKTERRIDRARARRLPAHEDGVRGGHVPHQPDGTGRFPPRPARRSSRREGRAGPPLGFRGRTNATHGSISSMTKNRRRRPEARDDGHGLRVDGPEDREGEVPPREDRAKLGEDSWSERLRPRRRDAGGRQSARSPPTLPQARELSFDEDRDEHAPTSPCCGTASRHEPGRRPLRRPRKEALREAPLVPAHGYQPLHRASRTATS